MSSKIVDIFFDNSCLIAHGSESAVAALMDTFCSPLTFAMQCANFLIFVGNYAIIHTGGLPDPRPPENKGMFASLFNWFLWEFFTYWQFVSILLSLVTICQAFVALLVQHSDCMRPFSSTSSYSALEVVVFITFPLQPIFLYKILQLFVLWGIAAEGFNIFQAYVTTTKFLPFHANFV